MTTSRIITELIKVKLCLFVVNALVSYVAFESAASGVDWLATGCAVGRRQRFKASCHEQPRHRQHYWLTLSNNVSFVFETFYLATVR